AGGRLQAGGREPGVAQSERSARQARLRSVDPPSYRPIPAEVHEAETLRRSRMRARNRLLTLVSGAFLFSGLASADPPAVPAGPSVATAPAGTEQRLRGTITAYDGQT